MAAGYSEFARHPSWIALAVFALLGWVLAIWSYSSSAQQSAALKEQIGQLEASRATALTEAESLRRNAGTVAALDEQIATARTDLDFLKAQQQQVGAELSRLREAIETAEQRHAQVQAQIREQTGRAAEIRAEADRAAERLQELRQELATAQNALETRRRELNALVGSVENRRNELARLERRQETWGRESARGSVQTGSVSRRGSEQQASFPREQAYRCVQDEAGWTCSSGP